MEFEGKINIKLFEELISNNGIVFKVTLLNSKRVPFVTYFMLMESQYCNKSLQSNFALWQKNDMRRNSKQDKCLQYRFIVFGYVFICKIKQQT